MKTKRNKIIVIVIIAILVFIGVITFNILNDKNKLSASEQRWINNNISTLQNVNVVNDVNIFGLTGNGVFYDFLNDFEKNYGLEINPVTFNYGENIKGITLGIKNNVDDKDVIFYKDHYVLVSKNSEIVTDLRDKKIGVLSSDLAYITSKLTDGNINLISQENANALLESFDAQENINYMIVPLTIYLDEILAKDYYIVDHLSDISLYYTISGEGTLFNILKKYYNIWEQDNLDAYYKRAEFNLFVSSLNIGQTQIDAMQSITYNYGFLNNSPYEVIMSGNYGGIMAMYLYDFSEFAQIDFNYERYRSLDKLKQAVGSGIVDLYFNYYNLDDNYYKIDSNIAITYDIVANNSNKVVIDSLKGLEGEEVYVQKNSYLYDYLSSIKEIKLKTYKNASELKKLNKKDVIIVIDKNIFDVYSKTYLNNYTKRCEETLKDNYDFKSKTQSAFYTLFSKYVMVKNSQEMANRGMYSHIMTVNTGSLLGTIAKYILISLGVFAIIFIVLYKSSKRIKVNKKIRKEDRMKLIDQLTSLKNRNYLNEYINNWNNNTVYPQTMIVIDLNNIQYINDTLGYEEGDKQIKACANILIKTQLDNSEIMRTDGNEFLVYLVGYTQKQVTNYIHKLNKEIKKLPYEYGAEFGYSIINDSLKTVEDAIIEATDDMKKQKKKGEEEKNAG